MQGIKPVCVSALLFCMPLMGACESSGSSDSNPEGGETRGLDPQDVTEEAEECTPWTKQFVAPGVQSFVGPVLAEDGGFVFAGFTREPLVPEDDDGDGLQDTYLRKVDANGDEVWMRQFTGGHLNTPEALWARDDGGLMLGGSGGITGEAGANITGPFVANLDPNGEPIWVHHGDPNIAHGSVDGNAAGESVYVGWIEGGYLEDPGIDGDDWIIVRLDANGNVLWTQILGATGLDVPYRVRLAPDGSVIVAGRIGADAALNTPDDQGEGRAVVARLSASGEPMWSRRFTTENAEGGSARLSGISFDDAAGIYITGTVEGSFDGQPGVDTTEAIMMKFNSLGERQWSTFVTGPGHQYYGPGYMSEWGAMLFVYNDLQYQGDGSNLKTSELLSLDPATGEVLVRQSMPGDRTWGALMPAGLVSFITGGVTTDYIDDAPGMMLDEDDDAWFGKICVSPTG